MGKYASIKELCEHRVFYYFYQISQIPRESGHEQEVSNYVYRWAKEHGFFVIQDRYNNIFIRKGKPKTGECRILLQAHMDMVCEKTVSSKHDFRKDPILWKIEGDYLTSGGETTLGADDGIGMALAMAVLEDDKLDIPAIEVLFTTSEEEDLSGAQGFDMSYVEAPFLVNLDHTNENEILCGSCGGIGVEVRIPVEWTEVLKGWKTYQISITGLKGGHSGEDIAAGNGNANRILARLLLELKEQEDYRLCKIKGGNFRLAIAREAYCHIVIPENNEKSIFTFIQKFERVIKKEYEGAAKNINISIKKTVIDYSQCCKADKLILAALFSPDGILEMSSDRKGEVNTSDNFGEWYLDEEGCKMIYEIRTLYSSSRDFLQILFKKFAESIGGNCKFFASYPSWNYRVQSQLREIAWEIYRENYTKKPYVSCVHAGLECGCFFEKKDDLDAISIGPNCWKLHSPEERLSISSVKNFYKILQKILKTCYEK